MLTITGERRTGRPEGGWPGGDHNWSRCPSANR